MDNANKLYKCYKLGCNFGDERMTSGNAEFLTQSEYDDLLDKDSGKVMCPCGSETCGIRELDPQDYPKPAHQPIDKKKALIFGGAAFVVLLVIGAIFLFTQNKDSEQKPKEAVQEVQQIKQTQQQTSPVHAEPEKIKEQVKQEPAVNEPIVNEPSKQVGAQTKTFSDGSKYVGEIKNGKMHGLGTYYYGDRQLISPKDLKKRYAEKGDYLIGEFYEGNVVSGKLYDSQNNVKEVIMIGR